jgi:Na+-transporting NADH:ubiquinone oxidoreductase subunit C
LADTSPLSLWRRFLALPLESRPKTLAVAFAVSAACAVLVTGATVILRPIQQANRAAEQQMRLEALVSAIPGMDEIMEEAGGDALSAVVVNLAEGRAAKEITPETIATAMEQPDNWTALPPEKDMAMIGSRPDFAQIYLLRNGEDVSLAILPVFGAGYNGPIQAMLALHGDMNTIAGLAVTDQSETPGLGARIAEPAWQASFAGTRVADEAGNIRFSVASGPSASEYEVDGITGATRTSNAISRIVRFWMGPEGYGPLIDAIRRGEF